MAFKVSYLWADPQINPINKKARSVPILNAINVYGRVFFFSWFSFLIAFWSWYAFPPLLHDVIAKDILSKNKAEQQIQVSNSNIVAICATLLVRLTAGPSCDRFGPRKTFAGCLLLGSVPTFLAGAVYNASGLYAIRFFIGILGGSFVPCQVWTTGFYDKNIVGTANSLTAGLGNAGGGITYFVMPAVYNSLVSDGLTPHVAWRVAFVVPGVLIVTTAIALLLLCPDTPTGKWSERQQAAETNLRRHSTNGSIVDVPGHIGDKPARSDASSDTPRDGILGEEKKVDNTRGTFGDNEAQLGEQQMLDTARGEIIRKPSFKDILQVMATPQTLVCGATYFCSFGAELSVNSVLGSYYGKNFPQLGLQTSGNWAAMFGLMNVVFRPLGGVVSDTVYHRTGQNVWAKKLLITTYGMITGAFLVAIGVTDPHNLTTMVCLVGVGLAFFLEGCNGLVFSLVPHVLPHANGVVSGFTGASGNLGGVIFAIIFRYQGKDYGKTLWVIGVIIMSIHVCISWIKPIPKSQIGGR